MKIGVSVPNNWGMEDPRDLIKAAEIADSVGFDSIWTAEHLVNSAYVQSRIGAGSYYHPLTTLSYAAARTQRISLGTSVIVAPFHNPFDLAKYVATLDQLSGGRVILGIGAGAIEEEFDAVGVSFKDRGKITDETLGVMRALWTEDKASYSGTFWSFENVVTAPKPAQARVPIWIGGWGKPAMRRTVEFGDGWHPTGIGIPEFREALAALNEAVRENGRSPEEFTNSMRMNFAFDGTVLTQEKERISELPPDIPGVIDTLAAWRSAGVDHFVIALNTADPNLLHETIDRLGAELLPALR